MGLSKVRVLKIFLGMLFILMVSFIVLNFMQRQKKQTKIPEKTGNIVQQKVEEKEKIEHAEVKGQKQDILVKADRQYMGKDNLYHLEGNVQIVFPKKSDGADVILSGKEIAYDGEGSFFSLQEEAEAAFKDMEIESEAMFYDTQKETLSSRESVAFRSERLSGSAEGFTFDLKNNTLTLPENVQVEIYHRTVSEIPFRMHARSFVYEVPRKSGTARGNIEVYHGKSTARAGTLEFKIVSTGTHMKSLVFQGNVEVTLIGEAPVQQAFQEQASLLLHSAKREIRTQELRIESFSDIPQVSSIEARGESSFAFFSDSGASTRIQAGHIKFQINREGRLAEFFASGNARITEKDEESGKDLRVEGEVLEIKGKKSVLGVYGKEPVRAKIMTGGYRISAQEIGLLLENNNFFAKGGIDAIFDQGKESESSPGFFSSAQPVFITAREMACDSKEKLFSFLENVRVWQGNTVLMSDFLSLNMEKRGMACQKNVRSVFFLDSPEKELKRKVEISAEKMDYNPDERHLIYEKNISMRLEKAVVQAQTLVVHFSKEGGEIRKIVGEGNVVIASGQNEGRGEHAAYDVVTETILLTGNPFLQGKNRGKTEGDKLTFNLADGRILVENQEQERSLTVIK